MAVILIGDFQLPLGVCVGANGVCFLAHLWDRIAAAHLVNAAYRPKTQIQNKRWLTQNGWLNSGEISAVMESL